MRLSVLAIRSSEAGLSQQLVRFPSTMLKSPVYVSLELQPQRGHKVCPSTSGLIDERQRQRIIFSNLYRHTSEANERESKQQQEKHRARAQRELTFSVLFKKPAKQDVKQNKSQIISHK